MSVLDPQNPTPLPVTGSLLWKPPGKTDPDTLKNQGQPCSQVTSSERWHKGEAGGPGLVTKPLQ